MNLSLIKSFAPINLKEIKKAEFMNRVDSKFVIHQGLLIRLLSELKEQYRILEINGSRLMKYLTVYFDTPENDLFLAHHNGKLNRYKVRKRLYLDTNTCFLEVKFKDNKGKTHKQRIPSSTDLFGFNDSDTQFLKTTLPFDSSGLIPVISNRFLRITLVANNYSERCTIDLQLNFISGGIDNPLTNLTIIEVKQDAGSQNSPLIKLLNCHHIHSTGFSKYCIGRVLNEKNLKYNSFKPKLRKIEKLVQNN